jgi:hypothetical protein
VNAQNFANFADRGVCALRTEINARMATTQIEEAGGQAAHAQHDTISFTSIEEQIHVS